MKLVPASVDQKLLFLVAALMAIGLVLVFSASSVSSLEKHHDKFYIVKIQATWMMIGLTAMLVLLSVDYHKLRALATPGLLVTIGFLLLVLVPGIGVKVNGATRWISMGPIRFQPSEIAKLAIILYLAEALARNYKKRESFREYILPNIALVGMVALLIVKQKALSSAILVTSIGMLMILVAYPYISHILTMIALGAGSMAFLIYAEPYRMRRLLAFFDPFADADGAGYQLIQSLMALGSGGLTGVGIGQGVQKIRYLPFVNTDFIFSVLGEEMGLVGSLVVIALFLGVLYRGVLIALRAPDLFGMFLAFGITAAIALQAFLNMAVVMGLMPTTGVPLPFISFGGNAMVYALAAVGILLNVSRATEKDALSRLTRRWSQG